MAIKNKDGTPYKLTSPNPIMSEQDIWRKNAKFVLHGNIGSSVVVPDTASKPIPRKVEQVKEFQPLKVEEKVEPQIVETMIEPDPIGANGEEVIQVWCLPGRYKEYVDPLYNEKYRKVVYGSKFLFEAIMDEQTDLELSIWTNTKAVTEGSILFPRTYDKRWWRVQSISPQENGYLLYAVISDYHPEFSDQS